MGTGHKIMTKKLTKNMS